MPVVFAPIPLREFNPFNSFPLRLKIVNILSVMQFFFIFDLQIKSNYENKFEFVRLFCLTRIVHLLFLLEHESTCL